MDLGLANLATETAGTRFRMLLFCRSVIDPAIGAGEIFGRPYATGHRANMRLRRPGSSRYPQPQLLTRYRRVGLVLGSSMGRLTIWTNASRTNVN